MGVKEYFTRKRLLARIAESSPPPLKPTCFVPNGTSGAVIYAVVLREYPEIVKVGRSSRWPYRRRAYDYWNFSDGDGVLDERVFTVTDEYVDLPLLEAKILKAIDAPIFRGREWFITDLEAVERVIDRLMVEHEISYT